MIFLNFQIPSPLCIFPRVIKHIWESTPYLYILPYPTFNFLFWFLWPTTLRLHSYTCSLGCRWYMLTYSVVVFWGRFFFFCIWFLPSLAEPALLYLTGIVTYLMAKRENGKKFQVNSCFFPEQMILNNVEARVWVVLVFNKKERAILSLQEGSEKSGVWRLLNENIPIPKALFLSVQDFEFAVKILN